MNEVFHSKYDSELPLTPISIDLDHELNHMNVSIMAFLLVFSRPIKNELIENEFIKITESTSIYLIISLSAISIVFAINIDDKI